MPLIRRKVKIENDTTTMQKSTQDAEFYVPPGRMQPGDIVIQPSSDRMLADLAQRYPKEYGALAKERGVVAGDVGGQDGDARALELQKLPAKDLVKQIGELDAEADALTLWAVFELEVDEERGGKNRSTVLEALAEKGIKEG
jgi:hypothetical protein